MNQASLLIRRWHNNFDYYDLLDYIEFNEDGSGHMNWGDGQADKFDSGFDYELSEPNEIAISWKRRKNSEAETYRLIFDIEEGEFEVQDANQMGPPVTRLFKFRISFDSNPFPDGMGRNRAGLDYFAGFIENAG